MNRENDILKLCCALANQSYSSYEIIIVDNGSTDNTNTLIREYFTQTNKDVSIIDGSCCKGSPYSARNLAVKAAKGDIIGFMDGYPNENWLTEAVTFMNENKVDLVAGNVLIDVNQTSSMYEVYDSIFSLNNEYMVNYFKVAPTANLLVKRAVFSSVGLFNESIRSGGDIIFTGHAVQKNFKLLFCKNAISHYFARNKHELITKQHRISSGQIDIWIESGKFISYFAKSFVKFFYFKSPLSFYKEIKSRCHLPNVGFKEYIKLYLIWVQMRNIMIKNNIKSGFRHIFSRG